MSTEAKLKKIVADIQPILSASLDSVCVVNAENKIVYLNLSMKNFLGLPARELKKTPVFCDIVKLAACEKDCQIVETLKTGSVIRLDEAPAARGADKLRILLKSSPIMDPEAAEGSEPIGAIITLRDTTGEVILQAKYHKVMQIIGEKDAHIATLEERIATFQQALRRARQNAAA